MSSVDQPRVRRTRTCLIAHDRERALPGYTLFTPMLGDGTVYLIDMDGQMVHAGFPTAQVLPAGSYSRTATLLLRQGVTLQGDPSSMTLVHPRPSRS